MKNKNGSNLNTKFLAIQVKDSTMSSSRHWNHWESSQLLEEYVVRISFTRGFEQGNEWKPQQWGWYFLMPQKLPIISDHHESWTYNTSAEFSNKNALKRTRGLKLSYATFQSSRLCQHKE